MSCGCGQPVRIGVDSVDGALSSFLIRQAQQEPDRCYLSGHFGRLSYAETLTRVRRLAGFLASDSPYIYRAVLQPGQGLISNNVLHDRSGFEDGNEVKRLLYRLRYYQRIADT